MVHLKCQTSERLIWYPSMRTESLSSRLVEKSAQGDVMHTRHDLAQDDRTHATEHRSPVQASRSMLWKMAQEVLTIGATISPRVVSAKSRVETYCPKAPTQSLRSCESSCGRIFSSIRDALVVKLLERTKKTIDFEEGGADWTEYQKQLARRYAWELHKGQFKIRSFQTRAEYEVLHTNSSIEHKANMRVYVKPDHKLGRQDVHCGQWCFSACTPQEEKTMKHTKKATQKLKPLMQLFVLQPMLKFASGSWVLTFTSSWWTVLLRHCRWTTAR